MPKKKLILTFLSFFSVLGQQKYVATTADAWTGGGNSYLGVTCHWIDVETRARKSVVLACTLMTQSHTYDYIASLLESIHRRFNIDESVVRCTTDNARNFRKSFEIFGRKSDLLSTLCVDDEVQEMSTVPMSQMATTSRPMFRVTVEDAITDGEAEDEEFLPLFGPLLPGHSDIDGRYQLPPQARCAAHTLNLIATVDLKASSHLFDPVYESTLDKLQVLWNYHSNSDKFRQEVKRAVGVKLKTPVPTRWNSLFDAVKVINKILAEPDVK